MHACTHVTSYTSSSSYTDKMPFPWVKLFNSSAVKSASSSTDNKDDLKYAAISPKTDGPNVLRFDHENSFAGFLRWYGQMSYCKWEKIITNDVKEMSTVLYTGLGLNPNQVKVSLASVDGCMRTSKKGLRSSFIECAKKVKENGNFIFYFAGHGYECGDRCILSPTDFNKEHINSGISGDDLVTWLNDSRCKANNLLFIFDCCYAGNLGEMLTQDVTLKTNANLFVICGCAPKEKVISFIVLKHSIFTYFLLDYLKLSALKREINIERAMEIVPDLCFSFSCLLKIYVQGKLYDIAFTPTLYQIIIKREGYEAASEKAIVSLLKSFTKEKAEWPLEKLENWLQSDAIQKSLRKLCESTTRSESLQEGIVSALLYSAAYIQYEDDDDRMLLGKRDLFLHVAIKVSNSISIFDVTIDHVIIGLHHYCDIVKSLGINALELQILYNEVNEHNNGTAVI